MSYSLSFPSVRALPSLLLFPSINRSSSLFISSKATPKPKRQSKKLHSHVNGTLKNYLWHPKNCGLAIQIGAFLASIEQPALAVTGVNNEEDLSWKLIQLGIIAFWYLLIMPPIILNWLRLRWYKRMFLEMYFQFMFVFMFFPGILLWAPFVNFRRLPRDPTMKYPWSTPQDPPLTDSK